MLTDLIYPPGCVVNSVFPQPVILFVHLAIRYYFPYMPLIVIGVALRCYLFKMIVWPVKDGHFILMEPGLVLFLTIRFSV